MASSSTNKQPLLVDRPLHEVAIIGGAAGVSNPGNLTSVIPSALALLVDCSGNDGASVESISIFASDSNTIIGNPPETFNPRVFCCLGDGSYYHCVAALELDGFSYSIGNRLDMPLPPLSVPVPSGYGEDSYTRKNTGLLVPAGKRLYVGVTHAVTGPTTAARLFVNAQGGYY